MADGNVWVMKCYLTQIEISDGAELCAKVTVQDENCVDVDLRQRCHTLESWRELSAKIEEAIKMMDLV